MSLLHHPSYLTVGIGAVLTILDLCFWLWQRERRWRSEFWDVLTEDLLRRPGVVDGLEECGLVEVHRDRTGKAFNLLYRGKAYLYVDVAEFLIKYFGNARRAAA